MTVQASLQLCGQKVELNNPRHFFLMQSFNPGIIHAAALPTRFVTLSSSLFQALFQALFQTLVTKLSHGGERGAVALGAKFCTPKKKESPRMHPSLSELEKADRSVPLPRLRLLGQFRLGGSGSSAVPGSSVHFLAWEVNRGTEHIHCCNLGVLKITQAAAAKSQVPTFALWVPDAGHIRCCSLGDFKIIRATAVETHM